MTSSKNKTTRNKAVLEYIGWLGVIVVLGSYALLALGVVASDSVLYHSLVLFGSLAVAAISYTKHAYQPAILNSAFALFAVIALARIAIINYG